MTPVNRPTARELLEQLSYHHRLHTVVAWQRHDKTYTVWCSCGGAFEGMVTPYALDALRLVPAKGN